MIKLGLLLALSPLARAEGFRYVGIGELRRQQPPLPLVPLTPEDLEQDRDGDDEPSPLASIDVDNVKSLNGQRMVLAPGQSFELRVAKSPENKIVLTSEAEERLSIRRGQTEYEWLFLLAASTPSTSGTVNVRVDMADGNHFHLPVWIGPVKGVDLGMLHGRRGGELRDRNFKLRPGEQLQFMKEETDGWAKIREAETEPAELVRYERHELMRSGEELASVLSLYAFRVPEHAKPGNKAVVRLKIGPGKDWNVEFTVEVIGPQRQGESK
ncbi:MAG: hypothetical protein HY077_02410 [Elusimicrobia bacterium]|nr:hypothetical protein [Elusimicrobiota bacterium]